MTRTPNPIRVGTWGGNHPEVWRWAEELGFDHLWRGDHYLVKGDEGSPMFDAWTALAAMASATTRIRVGTLVTATFFRHPSVLAKQAATIDQISGGRLEVGLGVGWNEAPLVAMGIPFHPEVGRMDRLEEFCQVLKALWTEQRANFSGRHFTLTDARAEPKPVQKPHPPIWIGGSGPKRTLKIAARHADVWNPDGGGTYEENMRALATLRAHCADVGRDPSEIRLSFGGDWKPETADADLELIERYAKAGFTEFILFLGGATAFRRLNPDEAKRCLEICARDALPRIRALAAA
jgi:F420-dependent oxidoreductase-like protein